MSYVPPHKRHENVGMRRASSVPPSLPPKLTNTKIIYANDCISRWFLVCSESEDNNFQLVSVSSEWRKDAEEKSLVILAKSKFRNLEETPWLWVIEKVEDDLILGFDRAKKTLLRFGSEDVKFRLIARFGKVVFHGYKTTLSPDVTISCKCMVDQQHTRLHFYKAELNALRHLILDVSCLDQDLDMRLTVDSKETLTNLSENEVKNLKELTDSAVIDPNVKGRLRWPLGKSSCANRYRVCGVWHTVTTTYRNPTLRLQVREADRYDFRTGIGLGTSREVNLKLKALSSKLLKEENVERKCVSDTLKDCLKAVWDYFLKEVVV